MQKLLVLFTVIILCSVSSFGQTSSVEGRVLDKDTKEVLSRATVQLLRTDSTFIGGLLTDEKGKFVIKAIPSGKYIIKISNLGYKDIFHNVIALQDKSVQLGDFAMKQDAHILDGAVITANLPKVILKEDTFVYNADAYRVAEGSTIEALVEQLPGAKIDDNGQITINGKQVKKILMDGREFMGGDTKTAMKNLPSAIIERIKAYDEKSDLSKMTGIDDGNEQTVLDFNVRRGMKKGFFVNADAGYGTHDRYGAKFMGARLDGNLRFTVIGNGNNTNDMGFSGRRGRSGGGRNGLNSSKGGGLNINYDDRNHLKLDGNINWSHSDGNAWSRSSSENFVSKNSSFSNSINQSYSRGDNWSSSMNIQWRIDSLTTLSFRPNVGYEVSDGRGSSSSASYNDDPYKYVSDPLALSSFATLAADSIMVNSRSNKSLSYGENKSVGTSLQFSRRLSKTGRNMAIGGNISYRDNKNRSLSASNVHLYQKKNALGTDSIYQTNRYNLTPSENFSYSVSATYTEPIMKATFLQLNYRFQYSHNKSNRATYDFPDLDNGAFDDILNRYREWATYFGYLGNPYENYIDDKLSRFSEYKNYNHSIDMQLRVVRESYNMNVGVNIQPQRSHFIQDYRGMYVDTVRNVINVSPTLNFRYRFDKQTNLRINYRGTTSQPSITQMLDITDDSNPLNITMGNPGLKPSFTSNMNANFSTYAQKHQRTISASISYSNTQNSIGNVVTYDENTGGRTTQPQNINGDWNTSAMFMINTSVDTTGVWSVNSYSQVNYNHYVSYITLDSKSSSQRNITRTTNYNERVSGSFRNSWLNVELDGNVDYAHTRNMLQTKNNMDTWRFSYGLNIQANAPWGMSLSTDIHEHSRRGYNDKSLNTNEMIWNLQLSQGFLRGKPLTVMLQFYDMLGEQSNFSRTINATRRNDTEYNSINSYAMLHVVYRMNMFGSRAARKGMNGDSDMQTERSNRGSRGTQGGRGGNGGGRSPRF